MSEFRLALFGGDLTPERTVHQILRVNDEISQYSLRLSEAQARALAEEGAASLKNCGRVEFGGGVADKLLLAFCNSPYLLQENLEETMGQLIEVFYYFKNETGDLLSDEVLIRFMKKSFDGPCGGSIELLAEEQLPKLVKGLKERKGKREASNGGS